MCDEGRFTYKRTQTERLVAPQVGRRRGRLGSRARRRRPRAVGRARRYARPGRRRVQRAVDQRGPVRAGAPRLRSPARRQGLHGRAGPGLARRHPGVADKNPNTAGAMAIGAGRLRSLLDLSNDLKAGAITALIVVGTRGVLGGGPAAAALPLDRLRALIAISTHKDTVTEAAHVALPLGEWTEVDGTFTNRQGMVQRVRAAVAARGRLAARLGDPVAPGPQAGFHHGFPRRQGGVRRGPAEAAVHERCGVGTPDAAGPAPLRQHPRLGARHGIRLGQLSKRSRRSSRSCSWCSAS